METAVQRSGAEVSPPRDIRDPPPPPPPDPPFRKQNVMIRIGDVDVPLRRPLEPSIDIKMERRKATKSGVTEEARKVLEQFLKQSLEKGSSEHYRRERQTLSEREYVEECPYMFLQSNESYYGNRSYAQRKDVFDRGFLTDGQEPLYFDEPDYAEPADPEEEEEEEFEQIPETQEDIDAALGHQHVSKTNSISSQSSFGLGPHPASRNRSPSDKLFLSVHPHPHLHSHPHLHRGPPKVKAKKHKELFDESSTSTEDYEYTENYLVSRKKKSFFKWASERLRQSFRRSNKLPPSLHEQLHEAKEVVPTIEEQNVVMSDDAASKFKKASKNKNKLKFNLKRNGSEKGSKSSSTPNEVLLEVAQEASESDSVLLLRTEDVVDQPPSERTERRRKSPVPWKRYEIKPKKKESVPPIDGTPAPQTKDKGIFDSFLKHIRKGSSKLKRKGSKDSVRQRSRSADNLTVQPLSKEHERVLQRYVSTHKKEVDYDSDSTTVRSFHEVLAHRVEQLPPVPKQSVVWYPPPLPPEREPSDQSSPWKTPDPSLSPFRRPQELEGLVPCHAEAAIAQCGLSADELLQTSADATLLEEIKQQQKILRTKPSESEDDVDGGSYFGQLRRPRPRRLKVPPLDVSDKPFHERTELEKEELYEKIAEQLAAIADQYNMDASSPRSSKSLSSPASHTHSHCCSNTHSRSHSHSAPSQSETDEGATATTATENNAACPLGCGAGMQSVEERLGALLQERGVENPGAETMDIPPMMAELVRNASYSQFKQMFNENIGSEPGWEQIAMMFRLTQTAVQLAGFGTAVALQIKEMTLKYFEDKFAGWIVGQGGWESVVENDSELD